MRIPFNIIFKTTDDLAITNKVKVRISGITLEENALKDYRGQFMGIEWALFSARDLDVDINGGTWVIRGIY